MLVKQGHAAEVDWWALGVIICELVAGRWCSRLAAVTELSRAAGLGNTPFTGAEDNEVQLPIILLSRRLTLTHSVTLTRSAQCTCCPGASVKLLVMVRCLQI